MKILLIGEYSRLHNSLKEGLVELNHEVLLIGDRDGFKNYDVDITIGSKIFNNSFWHPITKLILRITSINLIAFENAFRFYKILHRLKGYDVVQLINEGVLKTYPKFEIFLIKKLIQYNKSVFLLSCGIDYVSVKYAFDKNYRYSILTPLQEDEKHRPYYKHILNKLKSSHKKLHQYLYENVNGVISSDIDYHLPHIGVDAYRGMIPNPINTHKIDFKTLSISDKIIIFHGINTSGYIKKGNVFFDKALEIIKKKYTNKVDIIRTENIPYKEYIKLYDTCHIFLDQVYAYDQGYNALEAMSKGKVVFTGAEQQWLDYYNIKENTIAINALPNVIELVDKLSWLIEHPKSIIEIGNNARNFIEKEHDYIKITQKYVETWSQNIS
ncbi:glycosyltransferase [Psychroserpens burtonensis]|uniref:Glycosyltransferase n=1 Tax=Psychroserpens burtonensis TaxID=49278 RepID=A0A5C7B738_9FLAO|nr:glycosyltransferase [Psychroserpens burtonensis]TXE15602.1 glycosyltransferase [Psychroserpens burtonensis]